LGSAASAMLENASKDSAAVAASARTLRILVLPGHLVFWAFCGLFERTIAMRAR
jgi:hypothetical protein